MSNIPASLHLSSSAIARRRAVARLSVIIPLLVFFGIAALLLVRLGAGDPSLVPSALIGKPAPQFALEPLDGLSTPGTWLVERRSAEGARDNRERVRVMVCRVPGRTRGADGVGERSDAAATGGEAYRHRLQGRSQKCASLSRRQREPLRASWH